MRVFSALMSWSNENKICMRVDELFRAMIFLPVAFLKQMVHLTGSISLLSQPESGITNVVTTKTKHSSKICLFISCRQRKNSCKVQTIEELLRSVQTRV